MDDIDRARDAFLCKAAYSSDSGRVARHLESEHPYGIRQSLYDILKRIASSFYKGEKK